MMADHQLEPRKPTANAQTNNHEEESSRKQIFKLTVEIPPFWRDIPHLWFIRIEAQFSIHGIASDSMKYNYVVASLDENLASEVEDIILRPPEYNKYFKLKDELIRRITLSEKQRVMQQIRDEEVLERTPSQFLHHLRSLAGDRFADDDVLRQLWLRRMPHQVQSILSDQDDLRLSKLGELADKILEHTPSSDINPVLKQMETLNENVAEVGASYNSEAEHSSRQPSLADVNGQTDQSPQICWYHKWYGVSSEKCASPCSWYEEATKNGQ